jgi:peptidoglycan/LPS O-acetylase OafA/YrhL
MHSESASVDSVTSVAGRQSATNSQTILTSDRKHYFWIDALRGFAAIIVLISHVSLFGLYGYEHTLATLPPTRILWAGHQAVILFFVISGFVLFLLFEQMSEAGQGWRKFVLVRFLRLYPPYIASLLLAMLVLNAPSLFGISPPKDMPTIANGNVTPATLLGHFLMIGVFDAEAINPPIWSLVYEARLSLLFPVIFLLVAKGRWSTVAVVSATWLATIAYVAVRDAYHLPNLAVLSSMVRTVNLSAMFFVGATVAKFRFQIGEWIYARRPSARVALLILSMFVFMYSYGYSWPEWIPVWAQQVAELFTAMASAYFVGMAITLPTLTKCRMLGFFGTIAYSLYLVHQIVIMGVLLLFYGRCPAPILWIISITVSLAIAWLFYLIVEAPSVAASRAARSR